MITNFNIPRVLISAPNSGSGKTIVTCIILNALRKKGVNFCAYKTGPDYLDTKFLKNFGGCEVYNLDTWLMNKNSTQELFMTTSHEKNFAIIEGAMGLYDGGEFSSAEIAKLLKIPVILVINAKSIGESAAALALGFKHYDENINIAGVILNCVGSESHGKLISNALSKKNINVLGIINRNENLKFPERHLGLITEFNNENPELLNDFEHCIDIDAIIKIANQTPPIKITYSQKIPAIKKNAKKISLGIAYDEAFSFYYSESLEALRNHGIQLKFFSPLRDKKIPDANGYIFGGGYPELHAENLSKNFLMLREILNAANSGKIILAECGGFMYLCESLSDLENNKFEMLGIIPGDCVMTTKPVIGYIEARALRNNILCSKNEIIKAHEFHFSRFIQKFQDNAFEITRKSTKNSWLSGYSNKNILASYAHINFWGNDNLIENFIKSLSQ